jgi:ABC-type nickel/cobalt efflux system permease component RcnA
VAPLSRRGQYRQSTAGGLFPSPSALVVLLAAFQLHRVGLGLTLIGAFSVGLAATLTGVGLALVYGRRVVERRGVVPALRLVPIASAAAIVVLGVVFALSGAHAIR